MMCDYSTYILSYYHERNEMAGSDMQWNKGYTEWDSTKWNRVRTSSMAAWQRAAIQWASSSSVDVASTTEGPSEPITWSIPREYTVMRRNQFMVSGLQFLLSPPPPFEKYSCTPGNTCLPPLLQFHFKHCSLLQSSKELLGYVSTIIYVKIMCS